MNRAIAAKIMLIWIPVLAGCAGMGDTKYPQTADEFLSTYNWGGMFQNKEKVAVDRPVGAVVADVTEYAKKCLDINLNKRRASRYALDKYGSGTGGTAVPYNAKVAPLRNGATALSVQELYSKPPAGVPADGMFTLVAEIQGIGGTKTEVNIHHLAKPFLADPLKKWIGGDKRDCPAL
jgi:hypothetical protein